MCHKRLGYSAAQYATTSVGGMFSMNNNTEPSYMHLTNSMSGLSIEATVSDCSATQCIIYRCLPTRCSPNNATQEDPLPLSNGPPTAGQYANGQRAKLPPRANFHVFASASSNDTARAVCTWWSQSDDYKYHNYTCLVSYATTKTSNWSSSNWSAIPPTSIAGGVTSPYQQTGEQQMPPELGPMSRQSGLMQSQSGPPQHPMHQQIGGHEQHGPPGMPPAFTGPGGAMTPQPVMPRYIPQQQPGYAMPQ
ncbi:uncharacterized protein [Eurosta solidaginis]|uniref:uncharacterized protein isoform X2 n=1 Tax=Eurosta solidaginis TaxID=178769 RepID=UPI0035306F9B